MIEYTPIAQAKELPHDFGWAQFEYWSRVADEAANDPRILAWADTVRDDLR